MNEQDKTPPADAQVTPKEEVVETALEAPEHGPEADEDGGKVAAPKAADAEPPIPPEDEVAGLKERLLRALAETENLRARSERERQDTAKYAVTGFARDMITIADTLHRAISSIPETARQDETLKTLIEGIEMTERLLLQTLEKHGVRRIDPLGEKFDHNFHQAIFEVDSGDHDPGTVAEVVQAGFTIRDRLLRPAMVGVAKGRKKGGEKDGDPGKKIDTVA